MIRAFQRFSYDQDDQAIFSVSPTIKRIEFFSVPPTIKRIGDLQCSSYYQEDRRFSVFLLLSRGSVIFRCLLLSRGSDGSVFLLLSRGSKIFTVFLLLSRGSVIFQGCSYYKEVLLQDWLCSEKICTMH